ncbi:hypothetical protein PMAA_102220 [Talaromyces marneffei ATCC 18224]|uniref:PNPLA domain-containing protein n=1 Tax=Talaromyces marneffei (strain ATCC 18224 / CBS 334.59 / QM 7333) TaxID=441960 RepID=B6QH20_TALMQ|nr:hypothetical protein PMAA_102220 [Talaromyces marneffei ATCC 18224]
MYGNLSPLYLPPVKVNGIDFWDDGLLNNNPIDQVWSARHDLARNDSGVYQVPVATCVVSIGTGHIKELPGSPSG